MLQYIFCLIIWLRFDSSTALVPQCQLPISNATFPTRRSRLSCSPTSSIDLRFTGYFPSSIGHVLRVATAPVRRVDCRHLSSLLLCLPSLARLPCNSSQKPMKMYVFLSYLYVSAYIHVTVGYSICRLRTGEESPAAALSRFLAFCVIILHRFNLSPFFT
jgi:hypothetical protein